MEMTPVRGYDPATWFYDPAGVLVYFRRRANRNYDAFDVRTDRRLRRYTNLTVQRIRKLFRPYVRPAPSKLAARRTDARLARFGEALAGVDAPADAVLHAAATRFVTTTRRDLKKLM